MPYHHEPEDHDLTDFLPPWQQWRRLALIWGGLLLAGLLVVALTWGTFFKYVPPGYHLVIIAKNGAALDPGEVLARAGQKGIQRAVKGEGWHYITPIAYTTEVERNTTVPPGKVGIVTALGGKPLPADRDLAEEGEQGIQRHVLPPGTYRLNLHGYKVELVDATEIKPGYVGVVRRLLGTPSKGQFAADGSDEKGYLRKVLQPGLYYLNTKEFEVLPAEVGIIQTSFHADAGSKENPAIAFTSKGGFPISIDCTVEWEVLPAHMPALVAEYGSWQEVEKKVILPQVHAILRDKGIDYGIQDYLEGSTREKFQQDFTQELTQVCATKNVTVHSAFIRRIAIPEEYLKPIRERQIAAETQLTTQAKEQTAETENQVEREQRMILQAEARVRAETERLVAAIDQEVQNVSVQNEAEIEQLKADYGRRIATLDAERTQLLGRAEADATKLKETARSSLYQMKLDVFGNDSAAFLRYTVAQQLNPNLVLRLFHSGTGTFWTNLGDKAMNLLLPVPSAPDGKERPKAAEVKEAAARER